MTKEKLKIYWLYATVFVTGAAVLIIEIVGTRIVSPFYGSTIFVWSSMITVTLGALALGYYFGGKLIDKFPTSKIFYLLIGAASFFIILPPKIDQLILPFTDQSGLKYGPLAAATILFSIPLFIFGMASPMVIRLMTKEVGKSGQSSGKIFAVSTIGSIVGALGGGFFLLPFLSISKIFGLTALIILAVAAVGLIISGEIKHVLLKVFILFFIFGAFAQLPRYEYRDSSTLKIIDQKQSFYGDLKMIEVSGIRCIALDGATESCRDQTGGPPGFYFKEVADIINKSGARSLLVLGSGGGDLVAGGLDRNIKIDLVDIDPGITQFAEKYFGFSSADYRKLYIDDARHFLTTTDKKYDLIFVDLARGVHTPYYMYSWEALTLAKSRLSENGLMIMHILGGVGENDSSMASIVKTAETVFPSVAALTANPNENVDYLMYASLDDSYRPEHKSRYGVVFTRAKLNMALGVVLTDDKNPLDALFVEKYGELIWSIRNFVGPRGIFAT